MPGLTTNIQWRLTKKARKRSVYVESLDCTGTTPTASVLVKLLNGHGGSVEAEGMSPHQCIMTAEEVNFERRLKDAKFGYKKKHGYFPPPKWEDFHRGRFASWLLYRGQRDNVINKEWWKPWSEFKSSYKEKPPEPVNWDNEFGRDMEEPF